MEKNRQKYQNFMRQAIAQAKIGIQQGQTPFGACIIIQDKVIALSHNKVWQNTDITAHAEIDAIRQACQKLKRIDLSGATIYSTCEPCPMCFSACHWSRIATIVYGATIKDAQKNGFNELNISNCAIKRITKSRIKIISGILKNDNLELFADWAKLKKKQVY